MWLRLQELWQAEFLRGGVRSGGWGRKNRSDSIMFLLEDTNLCDDYGLVVTSELILGGAERCSNKARPMATPNTTIKTHTHHCGCLFLAL